MSLSDPISDMLTRIRNGLMVNKQSVSCPHSQLKESVLEVLRREGYIRAFSKEKVRDGIHSIKIELKYHEGASVIQNIKRYSKPGRRVYNSALDLPKVCNGLGISEIGRASCRERV